MFQFLSRVGNRSTIAKNPYNTGSKQNHTSKSPHIQSLTVGSYVKIKIHNR